MNLTEISARIDEIGNAWEHFKSVNDEKLKQIEKIQLILFIIIKINVEKIDVKLIFL